MDHFKKFLHLKIISRQSICYVYRTLPHCSPPSPPEEEEEEEEEEEKEYKRSRHREREPLLMRSRIIYI
jgi:hypothetical protein